MEHTLKLANRLRKAADYLSEGAFFADIGSDHAYLPCYVCLQDTKAKAIAGELNQGPYNRARQTVDTFHLNQRIDVRLGNGLEVINPEEGITDLVIAGMGGSLIRSILQDGAEKLKTVRRIITQPNVDERDVRLFFAHHGYVITNELILKEKGHIYEIIVGDKLEVPNQMLSEEEMEKQLLFGPLLLRNKTQIFFDKWKWEYEKKERIIQQMKHAKIQDTEKMQYFQQQLTWIEEVLKDGEDAN